MEQNRNRNRDDDIPNRASNMEQAEGSRASQRANELARNRQKEDLGTSSDRAMFEERESAEERDRAGRSGGGGEQNRSENAGGITNRPLDRERQEQEQLPDRGRSQSESEG